MYPPLRRLRVLSFVIAVAGCALASLIVISWIRSGAPVNIAATPAAVSAPLPVRPGSANPAAPRTEILPSIPATNNGPTFDVARIEPTGEAVIAGRARPGSTVELLGDGKIHGQAVADQSGEFVIGPRQLPPGAYELALRSTEAGGKQLTSKQTVPVLLQAAADRQPSATVPSQGPAPQAEFAATPAQPASVALGAVGMDQTGAFHVSGSAEPGADVKLFLNDSYIASATAGADRQFAFTINEGVTPGDYHVRLEQRDAKSDVVRGRVEAPFKVLAPAAASPAAHDHTGSTEIYHEQKQLLSTTVSKPADLVTASAVVVPKVLTTTVIRGDSLWRISRSKYGDGSRYPVIFGANRGQIRNPNLIYPGQIFVVPKH